MHSSNVILLSVSRIYSSLTDNKPISLTFFYFTNLMKVFLGKLIKLYLHVFWYFLRECVLANFVIVNAISNRGHLLKILIIFTY